MRGVHLPAVRRSRLIEALWRLHRVVYRISRGRFGGRIGRMPALLLTTRGRRSGRPRTVALTFLRHGGAYVVFASNAGEDYDPAWWLNLKALPEATLCVRDEEIPVIARAAQGEEREALWRRLTLTEPSYAKYQGRTSREFPVVVLEPRKEGGSA